MDLCLRILMGLASLALGGFAVHEIIVTTTAMQTILAVGLLVFAVLLAIEAYQAP